MVQKEAEKIEAIRLRKKGLSLREIIQRVPVAKSTVSIWLRSVGLSKEQKQRLTEKRMAAILRGGEVKRNQRIERVRKIHSEAIREIPTLTKRELWLMGIMLYWAEGSKEKEGRPGSGVQFTNSDPQMVRLFLKWLTEICGVKKDDIRFDIFIHENSKNNISRVKKYWISESGFPEPHFPFVYFKRNKIHTNRKNTGDSYFGLVKVRVCASSTLNRKIAGWIHGINKYYWGVV